MKKSNFCQKGKSCGATCISRTKVCLIDLPESVAKNLKKLTERASSPTLIHKGEKISLANKLSPLTEKGFETLIYRSSAGDFSADNNKYLGGVHKKYEDLYDKYPNDENLRNKLLWSKDVFKSVLTLFTEFSGDYYEEIRGKQKGTPLGEDFEDRDIQNMNKLLKALPHEPVVKYRGIASDDARLQQRIEAAKAGAVFEERAFTSWSTNPKTARSFTVDEIALPGERDNRIILRTVNKTGVSIRSLAEIPEEDEILTNRGRYRYTGYREMKVGDETHHFFDVEELGT